MVDIAKSVVKVDDLQETIHFQTDFRNCLSWPSWGHGKGSMTRTSTGLVIVLEQDFGLTDKLRSCRNLKAAGYVYILTNDTVPLCLLENAFACQMSNPNQLLQPFFWTIMDLLRMLKNHCHYLHLAQKIITEFIYHLY